MTKPIAGVAAAVGIILLSGSNPLRALGLGLVALAVYVVVMDVSDRLERVEQAVGELRDVAQAERTVASIARETAPPSSPTI